MSRTIAPRLQTGEARVNFGSRLPSEIKEYIRWYARKHNCSMSWVMEQIVIDYFELVAPTYIDNRKARAKYLQIVSRKRA